MLSNVDFLRHIFVIELVSQGSKTRAHQDNVGNF